MTTTTRISINVNPREGGCRLLFGRLLVRASRGSACAANPERELRTRILSTLY